MSHTTDDLEYITVDSIQWATGYVRPRMPLEIKREKHRAHQRQFMLRQRERIEQLRQEFTRNKLYLAMLQAAREAAELTRENDEIRRQVATEPTANLVSLVTESVAATPETNPDSTLETFETFDVDEAMLDLLHILPDLKSTAPFEDAYDLPELKSTAPLEDACRDQNDFEPLVFSPTSPADITHFNFFL